MKSFFFILAALCCLECGAQRLHPGDTYPDRPFTGIRNSKELEKGLSGLHRKLYLLHFWSTSCPGSIYQLEGLERLQALYPADVQIILVSRESADSVDRFFGQRKKLRKPSLPMVCNDTLIDRLFPLRSYPFAAWIGRDYRVAYVTGGYNTTEENIGQFLSGEKPTMSTIADEIVSGSLTGQLPRPVRRQIKFFSYLSGCVQGYNIGYETASRDSTSVRITANCSSVAELFKTAFEEGEKYRFTPRCKIVVEAGEPNRYRSPDDPGKLDTWEKDNGYNYEIAVPLEKEGMLYRLMQEDLQGFFPLKGSIEERVIPCMVLEKTGRQNKLKTKGGPPLNTLRLDHVLRPVNDSVRSLRNQPYSYLQTAFTGWVERATGLPFADRSGIRGKVDIDIPGEVYDSFKIELLNGILRKYDLALVKKNIRQLVLVLKEHGPLQ